MEGLKHQQEQLEKDLKNKNEKDMSQLKKSITKVYEDK